MSERSILVIDDEQAIRRLLELTLEPAGYKVATAATGSDGIALAANRPPDLILLDLGLPDRDGQEVLARLREWYFRPIIILSAKDAETEIVKALDHGANDYLTKPFRQLELLARIRSAVRDADTTKANPVMTFGAVTLDFAARTVIRSGELVKLTTTEYALLALLAGNEGRVLTHQFLLRAVWGPTYVEETQYLRVFIGQLRKKLEDDPNRPRYLLTESGIGYRFQSG
ncbi:MULTISPECIES: response regulator [unclassified Flavobacterium]|uniref:response regulator n=1 Tax=unclassified Flavobacterium TaxID=196869 RepID=UPI001F13036E|nr:MULTISPECIES: response regulator [unclassified Flavobacterium]UMY65128.1 response regulator [Flavobacterium sp. HJ-32-4]